MILMTWHLSAGGRGPELHVHDVRIGFSPKDSDLQLGEDKHSYALTMAGKKCTQKYFTSELSFVMPISNW
jgi:hypothetical protein